MSLPNGRYYILYDADREARHVFRAPAEDLSLLPKRIFALPRGVRGHNWKLENKGGGVVDLEADGAPTGVTPRRTDDGPYAFLIIELARTIGWKIEKAEGGDDRGYIITTNDGELAWTVTDRAAGIRGNVIGLEPKDGSPRQVFLFVKDSNSYGGYDDGDGDDDYFPSRAIRKPAHREKEHVPQSRFGSKRNGRGRNFCD
ncbi:hypothetical protein AOL_s00076g568 [Orbilia oligospora ATCC 24927]|uniref:Ricin B lectin domain-containing protein n=1 Tax=Arthrobotrys oligospora (strain ATCC 24927 / CBS 115.81 / DSM 1491) TaxID=756982 RepID=G1XAB0_ARTOA|nr:hypothetical protein AOL_s00076g568 [Orbilia oligospora ATCC 24927]EGX49927.1 hypothetical protein AOL_s00076g568 [Orbilia oligospora ATCC 24927]